MKKIISFDKELDFPSMIGEVTSISLDNTLEFIDNQTASGKFIISGTYKMTEASALEEDFNFEIPVEINLTETLDLTSTKIAIDNFNYEIVNDDILKCNIDVLIEGIEEIILTNNLENDEELTMSLEEEKINKEVEKLEEKIEKERIEEEVIAKKIVLEEKSNSIDLRECDGDPKDMKEIEVIDAIADKKDINEIKLKESEIKSDDKVVSQENNFENLEENMKQKLYQKEEEMNIKEVNIKNTKKEKRDTTDTDNNIGSLFQAFENSEETFTTYSVYILRKEDTIEKILDMYSVTREELSDYNDLSNLEIGSKIVIPTCNE